MSEKEPTCSCPFAEDAKTMDAEELEALLLPPDYPLVHFGKAVMPAERADYFRMGNSIWLTQIKIEEETDPEVTGLKNARGRDYSLIYRVYEEETGAFLGTGYMDLEEGRLKADKVFAERRGKEMAK